MIVVVSTRAANDYHPKQSQSTSLQQQGIPHGSVDAAGIKPALSVPDTWSRVSFSGRRAFWRVADAISHESKPILHFSERVKLPSVGQAMVLL